MTTTFRSVQYLVLTSLIALSLVALRPLAAQETDAPSDTPSAAPAGDLKTVAVVAAARYEKLIADITFLGTLTGKPEAGQMIEGGFAFFTQGKGAKILDKTQPLGVIVQTDGQTFFPIVCLPVTNADDLVQIATGYGAQVKDGKDGVKELAMADQRTFYLKHQNGWAFVSNSTAALQRLPNDPANHLSKLVTDYDLSVHVNVKDIPEMYRQFAIQAMQAGLQMPKQDHETEQQFELRQNMAGVQMEQMKRLINEVDSLTLGWAIDAAGERTYLDFTYKVEPGSKMAQQVAAYGKGTTRFAGFHQPDAAATFAFAMEADPELIAADLQQAETMMRSVRDQLHKGIDESEDIESPEAREALKQAASEVIDAFIATAKSGKSDGAGTLQLEQDSLTLVAGVFMKDPSKLESALKNVERAAEAREDSDFPGINWNAETHAGVKFHTLEMPIPEEQDRPRQLLGDKVNIAVGIGDEAVYFAAGRDHLSAVKQAIDASASETGKEFPPSTFTISLTPIMELAAAQAEEGEQKETAKALADMLRNEAQGRDHIRAVGEVIENGLRYRFEAEAGVLRAIGVAAAEAQKRALQAQE